MFIACLDGVPFAVPATLEMHIVITQGFNTHLVLFRTLVPFGTRLVNNYLYAKKIKPDQRNASSATTEISLKKTIPVVNTNLVGLLEY